MINWKTLAKVATVALLAKWGFQKFDSMRNMVAEEDIQDYPEEDLDKDLWLIPASEYDNIPDGFEVVDIFGKREPFHKGPGMKDARCGCLAYGVLMPANDVVAKESLVTTKLWTVALEYTVMLPDGYLPAGQYDIRELRKLCNTRKLNKRYIKIC